MKVNVPVSQEQVTKEYYIELLVNLFRVEQRSTGAERYVSKLKELLERTGYSYSNPLGEKYTSDRTDVIIDASSHQRGVIIDVFSPIIRKREIDGSSVIVQKGEVTIGKRLAK